MNRFTSRSGLSIDVDEITESFSVLLVEGNRVCLGFGVGGIVAGVAVRGDTNCVCGGCWGCSVGCTVAVGVGNSTGGVFVATDC